MPQYKILGLQSYADNLKNIKIKDPVILQNEKYNIKSKNAVGVYTIDNKKIGYLSIDKSLDTEKYKNSYTISKILLNLEHPIVEINRYYPSVGYIKNVEYPYIKKIKYNRTIIKPSQKTEKSLIGLINYFKTKKKKIQKIGITFEDNHYINIIILISKNIEEYYTVTNEYYTLYSDKFDELYENELIDNIFYRDFLCHRLECYFERNYNQIDTNTYNFEYNIDIISIHEETNIDSLKAILYLRYLIDNDDTYIIKKYNTIDNNVINKLTLIFNLYPNIQLGNFYYDHNLKIYAYINFVNDDHLIDILDNVDINTNDNIYDNNNKICNTIMKGQLCEKKYIIIYNPIKGLIYKIK